MNCTSLNNWQDWAEVGLGWNEVFGEGICSSSLVVVLDIVLEVVRPRSQVLFYFIVASISKQ